MLDVVSPLWGDDVDDDGDDGFCLAVFLNSP